MKGYIFVDKDFVQCARSNIVRGIVSDVANIVTIDLLECEPCDLHGTPKAHTGSHRGILYDIITKNPHAAIVFKNYGAIIKNSQTIQTDGSNDNYREIITDLIYLVDQYIHIMSDFYSNQKFDKENTTIIFETTSCDKSSVNYPNPGYYTDLIINERCTLI